MQTIAIVNEKGGTGKTTTAVNLAAALGEIGKSILLVDLDGQAATSRWLGVEEDTRLADAILTGSDMEPIKTLLPGVSLAPGCGKLDSVAHDLRPTQGGQLRKILSQLQENFDYVLIDCPPSLSNRMIGNALLAASHVIVPVEPSILALDGLGILLSMLDDVRDGFNHPIELLGVVVCRYDTRTRLSRQVLAELNRVLPKRVFHTVIRETVRMQECPASGKSILEFAPYSNIASDYISLAHEVVEAHPILDIEGNKRQPQLYGKASQKAENRLTIQAFQRITNGASPSENAISNSNTTDVTEDIAPGREFINASLLA
ncbi:MAG: ParA family protein, partial [Anaerolineales bacterium]|nr:ParA family protein [Anaerolineales bacterium]